MLDGLQSGPETTSAQRTEQLFELLAFLFLIVPSMSLSFLIVRNGTIGFVITAISTILRDAALVSLIAFFLWRNRESAERIGWNFGEGSREVTWGILLFVPVFIGSSYLDRLLLYLGLSNPATATPKFLTVHGSAQIGLAIVLVIVVAIAEETIFRGYLILRLKDVTGSTAAAIILSSVIFSLGHGYEGTAGVVTVGFMGLAFALVYVWRKSLIAPMVMHFMQDFLAIVILPLFHRK